MKCSFCGKKAIVILSGESACYDCVDQLGEVVEKKTGDYIRCLCNGEWSYSGELKGYQNRETPYVHSVNCSESIMVFYKE